jgi:multidrug efflux system membrane fusion protein
VPVRLAVVEQRDVPLEIRGVGNVEAIAVVQIKSRVAGQIARVYVRDGTEVQQGQVLFELDAQPFLEQVRQAEANLARDQALEKQALANLERDRAQARYARAQADRFQALFKEGIVSREQAEQATAAAEAAEAAVSADQAALESARAAIRADQARLADARLHLSYTRIAAPINGRAGAVAFREGNLVKENDATPLVSILQLRPVYVSFGVPEQQLAEIRRRWRAGGLEVEATPEGSLSSERGQLSFLDNAVDPATGAIKLKATFANTNALLWPGQFVNVRLILGIERQAVVIPNQAVQRGPDGTYVWVAERDQRAQMRPVEVARIRQELAVIQSGLQPGERVVTQGQLRLTPGARLQELKQ